LKQNPALAFCHLSYEGPTSPWEKSAFILDMEDKRCGCSGHADRSKQRKICTRSARKND